MAFSRKLGIFQVGSIDPASKQKLQSWFSAPSLFPSPGFIAAPNRAYFAG
jgi:hypothetical protein